MAAIQTMPLNAEEVKNHFNPDKPILPSSQYTPDAPYKATVWVYNDGQRYADQYYNHIWGSPLIDEDGHEWFAPEYELTDGGGTDSRWTEAQAPFSSDEYYLGQKSYRWITSEIMGEIYMRRTFTIASPVEGNMFLACGHDDAPSEWYINGTLVHKVSDGWNNDEYILLTDEQKALIKMDGSENLLAVHVHQNWGGAFADCGLYEADMTVTRTLLHTVADGEWECRYYMLNYNSDIEAAEAAGWASEEEDESDWIAGVGPFSNDENMFYITEWPSQTRPILVRRHFTMTAEDMAAIDGSELKLTCSYDENPKIYLNGTLIWSATGWNDNDYATAILSEEQKQLLHEGDNVLAVSLTQGGGGGHIDSGLELEKPYEYSGISTPAMTETTAGAENDTRIFNLHGQYLGTSTDNLPKGIYIRGGKKLVLGQ